MSKQTNSVNMSSATFSLESEDGRSPCALPDGQTNRQSGPAPAHANRSASPGRGKWTKTSATYGPLFEPPSPSASLQLSLESKLQARMAGFGSPEYELTWKHWDMVSGPPICALRASLRRWSASGCTGWPRMTVADAHGRGYQYDRHDKTKPRLSLLGMAKVMSGVPVLGWSRPLVPNGGRRPKGGSMSITGKTPDGKKRQVDVEFVARYLLGWPRPTAALGKKNVRTHQGALKESKRKGLTNDLCTAAMVLGWPRPTAITNTGGAALCKWGGTASRRKLREAVGNTVLYGALNPAFPCWLMGFPTEWLNCAALAMQSSRNSRRRSSKPATT